MFRGGVALAMSLVAVTLSAQEAPEAPQRAYTQGESPYLVETAWNMREPVEVFVEIGGLRVDTVRIDPQGAVDEGASVRCLVSATGSHTGGSRPTVTIAMLLEDQDGKGLERLKMEKFKPSRGRPFEEVQRLQLSGSALLAARKIFVMIEVE